MDNIAHSRRFSPTHTAICGIESRFLAIDWNQWGICAPPVRSEEFKGI